MPVDVTDPSPPAGGDRDRPHGMVCIGLMSGTSMDGADGVLVRLQPQLHVLAHAHAPFPAALRAELLALNAPTDQELHRSALASRGVTAVYAQVVQQLRRACPDVTPRVIGAHGVTVRHRPELGYTCQLLAPAELAEACNVDVVADLRSRDVAAGGQGAPLVPAFHAALWRPAQGLHGVVNLGGFANLSVLPARGEVTGFDCGPGNVLMDGWIQAQRGLPFDADGAWAAQGQVHPGLWASLCSEPYFTLPSPKSTGRDVFHDGWLQQHLQRAQAAGGPLAPQDVQRTLCELTAWCVAQAVIALPQPAQALIVCGGGARNGFLLERLRARVPGVAVSRSDEHGLPAEQVEACAFAWLAWQMLARQPGNLPSVTGARGPRILGALYPA